MQRSKKLISIVMFLVFLTQVFFTSGLGYGSDMTATGEKTDNAVMVQEQKGGDTTNTVKTTEAVLPAATQTGTPTAAATEEVKVTQTPQVTTVTVTPTNEIIQEKSKDGKNQKNKDDKSTKKSIIVKYKNDNNSENVKNKFLSKNESREIKVKHSSKQLKIESIEVSDDSDINSIINELKSDPDVEYAQPDYVLDTYSIPQDERFTEQWALSNNGQTVNGQTGIAGVDIQAVNAWDITAGSNNVVVAVVDTGVDINHTDLSNNIYKNPNEQVNGIDDDGNGYIDDVNGWDFANNDKTVYDSETSDTHGTHVAGIIAAESNSIGISGVAPNVKILPLKFINGNTGYTSDAIEAIEYASTRGASIINCSWGGSEYNTALKEVMEKSGALFVCAAGNAGRDVALSPVYPACFDLPNIISVAAIDNKGALASFSNYGSKVHIAAPGVNILSTLPGNKYGNLSGTSMAAPVVSGTAALLKSKEAVFTASQIKSRLINTVAKAVNLTGKVISSGRVHAANALLNKTSSDEEVPVDPNGEVKVKGLSPNTDTSAQGNNKTVKPLVTGDNTFIDSVIKTGISKMTSNNGIENLSVNKVKENFLTFTWMTSSKTTSEVYYGTTENMEMSYKVDALTTKHQVTVKVDNIDDVNYYNIQSVAKDGTVLKTDIRSIKQDITDLGGNAPQDAQTSVNTSSSLNTQNLTTFSYINDNNANHSFEAAQQIPVGTVFGTVAAGVGSDYYAVNFEAGKTYSLDLKGMAVGEDYDLCLYNAVRDAVGWSFLSNNYDERINYTCQTAGTYYIQVIPYVINPSSEHHNYQLMVYPNDLAPDSYEPNDSMATAKTIADNATIFPTINITTDEDWYVLDTTKTGKLNVSMKSLPSGCDFDLQVYKADGSILGGSYAGGSNDEKAAIIINTPGKYYIRVYSYTGSNATDSYELFAGVFTPDTYEINDNPYEVASRGTPAINLESSVFGTIDNKDDADCYKFVLSQDTKVGIRLQNIPASNDYDLILLSSTMANVAGSFNSPGVDETIIKQLATGTYYIKVYSYSGYSETQNYKLSLGDENLSKVWMDLDKTSASVGDIITATVKINNINNFAGYEAHIRYNPSVVQPVMDNLQTYVSDTMPTGCSMLLNSSYSPFEVASHDLKQGILKFGRAYINLNAYRNSNVAEKTGILAIIKFKVLKSSPIYIKFDGTPGSPNTYTGLNLYDWNGNTIDSGYTVEQPANIYQGLSENSLSMQSGTLDNNQFTVNTSAEGNELCTFEGYIKADVDSSNTTINAGFTVTLEGTAIDVQTDNSGYFKIENVNVPANALVKLIISKSCFLKRELVYWPQSHCFGTVNDPVTMWGGDINSNMAINMEDIMKLAGALNTTPSHPNYEPTYDLNLDNAINFADVMTIAKHFSQTYPLLTNLVLDKDYTISNLNINNADDIVDLNGHTLQVNDQYAQTDGKLLVNKGTLRVGNLSMSGGEITVGHEGTIEVFGTHFAVSGGTLNLNGGNLKLTLGSQGLYGMSGGKLMVGLGGTVEVNAAYFGFTGGTIDLSGGTFTTLGSCDFLHAGGNLKVNGGKVNVGGNFKIQIFGGYPSKGTLTMTDPNDYVLVNKDFIINTDLSTTRSVLNEGTLEVKGNFTQGDVDNISPNTTAQDSFHPTGNHKVFLSGDTVQTINFKDPTVSQFNTLILKKSLNSGRYNFVNNPKPKWNKLIELDKLEGGGGIGTVEDGGSLPGSKGRSNHGVASVNTKLYMFGGIDEDGNYPTTIGEYDPITGSWVYPVLSNANQTVTTMAARSDLGVAAADNNQIYLLGGQQINGQVVNTCEVFDTEDKTISPLPGNTSMTAKKGFATVVYKGKYIYTIGGVDAYGNYLNTIEIYDIENSRWINKWINEEGVHDGNNGLSNTDISTNNLQPREGASAVIVGNKLYFMGGRYKTAGGEFIYTKDVYEYDFEDNSWSDGTDMNSARYQFAATVFNNTIYALCGQNAENSYLGNLEVYNADPYNTSSTWTVKEGNDMPLIPRSAFGIGMTYSQIYLLGGKNIPEGQNTVVCTPSVQKYYPVELPGMTVTNGTKGSSRISVNNGNYTTAVEDIRIESTGLPISLSRTYDSSDNQEKTVLGNGWRWNYDAYVKEISNYYKVTASALNLRKAPGLGASILATAAKGAYLIKVDDEVKNANGINWIKVRCLVNKYGNFVDTYVAQKYVELVTDGLEVKMGAGSTTVYDKVGTEYKAPFGCYDKLTVAGSTYTMTTPDNTKYQFTRLNNDIQGVYRLTGVVDKYANKININWDASYRIDNIEDNQITGRKLTFDYSIANQITVEDSIDRQVTYFVENNLTKVTNIYGKNTYYTYMKETGDTSDIFVDKSEDKKNINKLARAEIDDALGNKQILFTNSYNEVTGRRYKQTDGLGKIQYWMCLDVQLQETNEDVPVGQEPPDIQVLGTVKRIYYDENSNDTTTTFTDYLKQPKTIEYADDSKVEYTYEAKVNGAWVDTTNYTKRDAQNVKFNVESRVYEKDRYGYTTMTEKDIKGNIVSVSNKYLAGVDNTNDVLYQKYQYDANNNILKEWKETGAGAKDSLGFVKYEYYPGTNKIEKVGKRIQGISEDITTVDFAITEYTYDDTKAIKGLIHTVKNADGKITTTTYKSNTCYIETLKDPEQNTTTYTFDAVGRKTSEIMPMGSKTVYEYEESNGTIVNKNVQKVKQYKNAADAVPISTSVIVYDGYGRKVKEVTPRLYKDQVAVNPSIKADELMGNTYIYYPTGKLKSSTIVADKNDQGTGYIMYTTEYTYDNAGNVQTEKKPDNTQYIYGYDNMDRLSRVKFTTDTMAIPVLLERYDYSMEHQSDQPDAKNMNQVAKHSVFHNEDDRTITITTTDFKLNTETTETKEGFGSDDYWQVKVDIIKKYNPNGTLDSIQSGSTDSTTYYEYDGLGRTTGIWTPVEKEVGGSVKYAYTKKVYSNSGNLMSEQTGKEKVLKDGVVANYWVKSYIYNDNGQLKSVTVPEGTIAAYEYDADGNLSKETLYTDEANTANRVTEYKNNYLGKPDKKYVFVEENEIQGVNEEPYVGTNFSYAALTNYEYDEDGNMVKESASMAAVDNTDLHTLKTYGTENVKDYSYDYLQRQKTATQNDAKVYNETSQTDEPADIVTKVKYTWDGKTESVTDGNHNTTNYEYFYTDTGRVEIISNPENERAVSYYDWSGRLIAEVSPVNFEEENKYDFSRMNRTEYVYSYIIGEGATVEKKYKGDLKVFDVVNKQWITNTGVDQRIKKTQYDLYGNIVKEWDGKGSDNCFTQYSYNLANQLTTGIDPETKNYNASNNTSYYNMQYDYDTLGRKVSETALKGYESEAFYVNTTYIYDYSGNILTQITKKVAENSDEVELNNTYYLNGKIKSHTDAKGKTTEYFYYTSQQLEKVENPVDVTMQGNGSYSSYDVNYQYDMMGNAVKEFDNMEKVVLSSYDAAGRLLSVTAQKASTSGPTQVINTSTSYDMNGNKRVETDGKGNKTVHTYDTANRLLTSGITNPDSGVTHETSYSYDDDGNVTDKTNSVKRGTAPNFITSNSTESFNYDELGRLIEKIDGKRKSIQKLVYDENSSQKYSFDAYDSRTDFVYDDNGRLIQTSHEHDTNVTHTESQTYDFAGNVRKKTDGRGNETKYIYNEFDELAKVISPTVTYDGVSITNKMEYRYDKNGNLEYQVILNETGSDYKTTTYEYNAANQMTKKIDHGGRTGTPGSYIYEPLTYEEYKYYPNGDLYQKILRDETTYTYTYDIHGRITAQEAVKGSATVSIYYDQYDNNGNQGRITNDAGETTRMYDAFNRVTSKKMPGIETANYYYDKLILDVDGETYLTAETAETFKDQNSSHYTTKVYDQAGRLAYVIDGNIDNTSATVSSIDASKIIKYTYYDNGSTDTVVYPYGVTEEYTYYKDGLLRTLTNKKSNGEIISQYTYTYDAAHNQIGKVETIKKADGTSVNRETSYGYDALNRLQTVSEPDKTTTYTYDRLGNRDTETIESNSSEKIVNDYSYIDPNVSSDIYLNRLYSITSTKTTASGVTTETTTYVYDPNGNQTQIKKNNSIVTKFDYDLLNQLIAVKDPNDTVIESYTYNGEGLRVQKTNNTATTKYLYEYDKVVLELETQGAVQKVNRNIYGANLLTRTVDGQTYYYMYNGHADVVALINTSGAIAATYYYDAFGNLDSTLTTGSVNNNITYAGYQYDSETGLYYLNSRVYDPKIARFLQEDTYTGDPNDPLSLNLYTYCHNEPIMYTDPTGHMRYTWQPYSGHEVVTGYDDKPEPDPVIDGLSNFWGMIVKKVGEIVGTQPDRTLNPYDPMSFVPEEQYLTPDQRKMGNLDEPLFGDNNLTRKRLILETVLKSDPELKAKVDESLGVNWKAEGFTNNLINFPANTLESLINFKVDPYADTPMYQRFGPQKYEIPKYQGKTPYFPAHVQAFNQGALEGNIAGEALVTALTMGVGEGINIATKSAQIAKGLVLAENTVSKGIVVKEGMTIGEDLVENFAKNAFTKTSAGIGDYSAQIPRFGPEWNAYYQKTYGSQNVSWVTNKIQLSKEVKSYMNQGQYPRAMDFHYEDLIKRKTGGVSIEVNGREIDCVTDTQVIQAKRSISAIEKPDNFLNKKTKQQIKATIEYANSVGKTPEYWFKYGVSPEIRAYLEKKGITVRTGLGEK